MTAASVKAQRTTQDMKARARAFEESLVQVVWRVVAAPPDVRWTVTTSMEDPERLERLRRLSAPSKR